MTSFTQQEKMAMAKILMDIVSVDEKIDVRETLYFEKVKDILELTTQDHFELLNLNTLMCLSIVKRLSDEQKTYFAEMMRHMILADEYIDPKEASSFYDICDFIQIHGVGLNAE
mgnify:FL=1